MLISILKDEIDNTKNLRIDNFCEMIKIYKKLIFMLKVELDKKEILNSTINLSPKNFSLKY